MSQADHLESLRRAYKKVFSTAAGKKVLMDIYANSNGTTLSLTSSFNPFEMAFGEGKRFMYLRIQEMLKLDDLDSRHEYDTNYLPERRREEAQ